MSVRALTIAVSLLAALLLAGCSNPDAPVRSSETHGESVGASAPHPTGEPAAAAPPSPTAQAPVDVERLPQAALEAFAELYINWSYRTLAAQQRRLVAMSVGAARIAERQAAASSSADSTISRGALHNSGSIASISEALAGHGAWVIVTREQTAGSTQYEGLPAGYHVTLARLAHLPGGYAVSEWLPQS